MATDDSQSVLASRIADLLYELTPEVAIKCESFRQALYGFIERGNHDFRDGISTCLEGLEAQSRRRKRTKTTPCASEVEKRARTFFEQKRKDAGKASVPGKVEDLICAVVCLQSASAQPQELYTEMVKQSRQADEGSRQKRCLDMYRASEAKSCKVESERRLDLLHVEYEVKLLEPDVDRGQTSTGGTESRLVAAEREFAQLAEADIDSVRKARRNARPYLHMLSYDNGLGMILMLGSQTRALWERTLSNAGISWVLEFCRTELIQVAKMAEELQSIACEAVMRGFVARNAHPAELQEEGHLFSAHFARSTPRDTLDLSTNALETLAAAADHVRPSVDLNNTTPPYERADTAQSPVLHGLRGGSASTDILQLQRISTTDAEILGPDQLALQVYEPLARPGYSISEGASQSQLQQGDILQPQPLTQETWSGEFCNWTPDYFDTFFSSDLQQQEFIAG